MSVHHFDTRVAEKVGLNAAVIAYSIQYWCTHKEANQKDIHDGKAWVYNSMKAWSELLPYLSEKQIRTALKKLEDAGIIQVRNLNEKQYDQTRWYAYIGLQTVVTIANRPNGQMDLPKKANAIAQMGNSICPKGQTNTNNKPNHIPNEENDGLDQAFDRIWAAWSSAGRGRSKSKANCKAVLKRLSKANDLEVITNAAVYYAKLTDGQYHKGLHLWLSGGFWEQWTAKSVEQPAEMTREDWALAMRQFVDEGEWPIPAISPPPTDPDCKAPADMLEAWRKHYGQEQAA